MRWTGLVTGKGDSRCAYRVLMGRPEGKRPLGKLRVSGSIVLKWIFKKRDEHFGGGLSGSG